MKRCQPENGVEGGGEATKHSKHEGIPPDATLSSHIEAFDAIQKELQKLDEECAREQMLIQKTYDAEKKPHFERRQALIEKIPGFWCQTFQNHPALSYMNDSDIAVLQHLKRVELDDNLDDNGSYRISFQFSEQAAEYFEPLTLAKHVKFENNEEIVVECTDIKWKDGKNPIDDAQKKRQISSTSEDWSIFEWFTTKSWDDKPDLGEVIRREIWHAPLAYFMEPLYAADGEDGDDVLEGDEGAEVEEEDDDGDEVRNA